MEYVQHFNVPSDVIKIILTYTWTTKLHPILCILCKYINKWLHTPIHISYIREVARVCGAWGIPRTIPLLVSMYENKTVTCENIYGFVSCQLPTSNNHHQKRFIITDDTITNTRAWYYALALILYKHYAIVSISSVTTLCNLLYSIGITTYYDCRLLIGVRGLATRINMSFPDSIKHGQQILSPGWLLSPSEDVVPVWVDSINKVQKITRRDMWRIYGNDVLPKWTQSSDDLVNAIRYIKDTPSRHNVTYFFEMLLLSTTKWLRTYEYGDRCLSLLKYLEPEDKILRLVLLEIGLGETKYQIDVYVNELCRIYTYQRVLVALGSDIMRYCSHTRLEHTTTL